jgi:hypothetical protein
MVAEIERLKSEMALRDPLTPVAPPSTPRGNRDSLTSESPLRPHQHRLPKSPSSETASTLLPLTNNSPPRPVSSVSPMSRSTPKTNSSGGLDFTHVDGIKVDDADFESKVVNLMMTEIPQQSQRAAAHLEVGHLPVWVLLLFWVGLFRFVLFCFVLLCFGLFCFVLGGERRPIKLSRECSQGFI